MEELRRPVEYLRGCMDRVPEKKRYLIGLAGVPGSGKSTLVTELITIIFSKSINHAGASAVHDISSHGVSNSFSHENEPAEDEKKDEKTGQQEIVALGMDGFHLTRATLARFPNPEEAFARRGAPWTFDPHGLAERLQQVRLAGGECDIGWPTFEHSVGDPVERGQVVPSTAKLIIVEGLYLLHDADGWEEVGRLFDERWYLDTPFDLAMERLVHRHMEAWGISRVEAEARIAHNDRLNAEIVLQSRDRADKIVRAMRRKSILP